MKRLLLTALSAFGLLIASAQVAISVPASAPDPSAILDVKSTTKGMLLPRMSYDERIAIGSPATGLMVYQINNGATPSGFYTYSGVAWRRVTTTDDLAGGTSWTLSGTNLYSNNTGNVGIGQTAPAYKLDVSGKIHSTGDLLTDGYVGIGTTSPSYKLQVNDGSIAIFNTTDVKTWYFSYSSSGNYLHLAEGGINRMTFANGGNVGIGTTAPAAKLHVNGTATIEGATVMGSDASVAGSLTVNSGKGVLRSWNSDQIKYYTQESTVHAVLPAFGTSPEATIAWPAGIFTAAPQILVGDITSTGGTVGQLFRVQMVTYDATPTSCHFRLINTSNGAVDYNITWNIVYLGK